MPELSIGISMINQQAALEHGVFGDATGDPVPICGQRSYVD